MTGWGYGRAGAQTQLQTPALEYSVGTQLCESWGFSKFKCIENRGMLGLAGNWFFLLCFMLSPCLGESWVIKVCSTYPHPPRTKKEVPG